MNVNLLIDAIVRQTTILIAHLATLGGTRSPLAHMANQIFVDLVRELKEQGVGNKVIADMFGLSLRTYHNRVRRMSESSTERGLTLWEAIFAYVQQKGAVQRGEVQRRFRRDDEILVRGVLKDLVESGLLCQSGVGERLSYTVDNPNETEVCDDSQSDAEAELIWVAISRWGPVSAARLQEVLPLNQERLDQIVEKLVAEKRIRKEQRQGEIVYECDTCLIPINASFGWEAAVLDHYQAMVTAICTKLRKGLTRAQEAEVIGGSTYSYEVWDQHPLKQEALGFLQSTRQRAQDLRRRIEAYNQSHPADEESKQRVFTYVGQTVIAPDEREET